MGIQTASYQSSAMARHGVDRLGIDPMCRCEQDTLLSAIGACRGYQDGEVLIA
jgi:hypothetical protein